MTEGGDPRAAALAALAREAGGGAFEHPAPERLFEYHEGLLAAGEEEAVRDHLVLCADCTHTVLELAGVVQSELPEGTGPLDAKAAAEIVAGIRARAGLPPSQQTARRRVLLRIVLPMAASIAAIALATVVWQRPRASEGVHAGGARANVLVRDLVPVGAEGVRREREMPVELPPATEAVVLVLNLADLRAFPAYRVALSEQGSGKILWTSDSLARSPRGSFTLELSRPFPGSGRYRIQLCGLEGRRLEPLAEYRVDLRTAG